ncbi:hypothetical protein DSM112329_00108 [Paraconexibacter sp. AEG42_29]|uniref:Polysaccharide biosynthesis protein n=1 Tax=Paraconexibacter sp. AEG42_29 TaxID=2997339 RepID=A0AAU7ANQ8_9ACTN
MSADEPGGPLPDRQIELALEDVPVGPVLQAQAPEPSQSGLLRSGATVMLFAAAANGLNVVFHLSVARFLEPDEYALLTTIFAINVIATVPLLALQTTVAREMAILLARGDVESAGAVLRTTFTIALRFAAGVCVLLVLLSWPAFAILNIERPLPILATALSITAAVPLPAAWGALQASERFTALSVIQGLGPFLKLVLGVGFAAFGLGASAITFGVVIANIIVFGLAYKVLAPVVQSAGTRRFPARKVVGRYAVGSAACLGLYTVLTQSDVIWARGALSAGDAGDYAAASVMGNFVLLLPIGVTTVLFPRIAKLGQDGDGRRDLAFGLGAVIVLSLPLLVAFAAFPRLLLQIAFGSDYLGASSLLLPIGLSMLGYALVTVYMNHFLALGRTRFVVVLGVGILAQQFLFLLAHDSPGGIVWVQVAAGLGTAAAAELYEQIVRRRRPAVMINPA